MSEVRLSIHDGRDGTFMTTIQTNPEWSSVLNDFGKCTFPLAVTDLKALRRYLDFGKLVYVDHATLPVFGGVLDPDESWTDDGQIEFNAYSGEYLLKFRRTPATGVWSYSSCGAYFRAAIAHANASGDLLIREGSIWEGGTGYQDTMDGRNWYEHLTALSKNRGYDWSIDPAIDPVSHNLYFVANFYERLGTTTVLDLKEGRNIEKRGTPLRVQRSPINDLLGLGEGSDASRPSYIGTDAESIQRYGLRQGSEDFSGNKDVATVTQNTVARLKELRHPRRTFQLGALNVGQTYSNLRKGNVMPLRMHTVGFLADGTIGVDTLVRLLSIKCEPSRDRVPLTVDEVIQ